MDVAWVYILECSDGSYYTGKTQNLRARLEAHKRGFFKGYTFNRRPVKLVFSQGFPTFYEAIAAERQVKGWCRAKKQALINGDFDLLHKLAGCQNETHYRKGMRNSD